MSGRLFLASMPDADTAARIYHLAEVVKRARRFDGKLIEPDCLHITLFFLDGGRGLHERTVRMACEAAQQVRMPSFEVSFDRIASFRGRPDNHPFVLLGDDGLNRLKLFRQTLGAEMTRKGLRRLVTTDFTPHVTLLYGIMAQTPQAEPAHRPQMWARHEGTGGLGRIILFRRGLFHCSGRTGMPRQNYTESKNWCGASSRRCRHTQYAHRGKRSHLRFRPSEVGPRHRDNGADGF
jgi:RNA 2',3'-cyclic 3'-phosphodiesterase